MTNSAERELRFRTVVLAVAVGLLWILFLLHVIAGHA